MTRNGAPENRLIAPFLGRSALQPAFRSLHKIALAGLGMGRGKHPGASGEEVVMALIAKRTVGSRGPVVFDVGAHVGVYTSLLLEVLGESAVIFAFEPSPTAFADLEARVAGRANVGAHNVGLSDHKGMATLYAPVRGSKIASLHDRGVETRPGRTTGVEERVRLTTIDEFCRRNSIERIDLLKIDVEGHELAVLQGAQGMLGRGAVDAIQFEFGVANIESRTYMKDFYARLSADYTLFRIVRDGPCAISGYDESLEVFVGATNYLALRKNGDLSAT